MKNNLVKAAAAVPELKVGDTEYNLSRISGILKELSDCALVVFPELSITGYTSADLFLSDTLLNASESALVRLAQETADKSQTVVAGVPVRYKNCLYNCGAVLSQGEIKALIPKSYLPNYSEFYECR